MRRINIVYILAAVLLVQILLATMVYNEPTFTTSETEYFQASKAFLNQAVNVAGSNWVFNESTRNVEISVTQASVFERSIYDVGIYVNTPLVKNATLHAKLLVSEIVTNRSLVRAFVVLNNGTNTVELSYCIGMELEDVNPDPKAPSYSYLYFTVSNMSNSWVTINRNVVDDLAAKNISIGTDDNWKISRYCIGAMLYQGDELVSQNVLVDTDQTFLDIGAVLVLPGGSAVNMTVLLLIVGLFVFSVALLVVDYKIYQRGKTTH